MFDVVVLPNACNSGMHIGHVWTYAFARSWYHQIYSKAVKTEWPEEPKWVLVFADGSQDRYEEEFLEGLNWLGWLPDRTVSIRDYTRTAWHPQLVRTWARGSRADSVMHSLLFLQNAPRHWRGHNLVPLRDHEESLSNLYHLALPDYHYVCMLHHGGHPICGAKYQQYRRANESYPFMVDSQLMSKDPFEVVKALWGFAMRAGHVDSPPFEGRSPGKDVVDVPVVLREQNWFYGGWPSDGVRGDTPVEIPLDWADGIPS